MGEPFFKLENLHSGYGQTEVIKGISLHVEVGEVVTLIGANGAGKTSTLLCVSGLSAVSSGEIWFQGKNITNLAPHEIVCLGLIHIPEGRKIFPRLNVLENLQLGAYLRKDKTQVDVDLERVFELFPVLRERRTQSGGTLSGGEQQMLAIARGLMGAPKMLLMDEPSMGISPVLTEKIFETIKRLNEAGMTILLVEQNASLALSYSQRAYVLETGKIVLKGNSSELLCHPRVREAYLGGC